MPRIPIKDLKDSNLLDGHCGIHFHHHDVEASTHLVCYGLWRCSDSFFMLLYFCFLIELRFYTDIKKIFYEDIMKIFFYIFSSYFLFKIEVSHIQIIYINNNNNK